MPTDVRIAGVRRDMARGLARFIAEADDYRDMPNLPRRQLLNGQLIWPKPHNVLPDFDAAPPWRGVDRQDSQRGAHHYAQAPAAGLSSVITIGAQRT